MTCKPNLNIALVALIGVALCLGSSCSALDANSTDVGSTIGHGEQENTTLAAMTDTLEMDTSDILNFDWKKENTVIAYGNGPMSLYHESVNNIVFDGSVADASFDVNVLANGVQRLDLSSSGDLGINIEGGETITGGFSKEIVLEWPTEFNFAVIQSTSIDMSSIGTLQDSKFTIIIPESANSEEIVKSIAPSFKELGVEVTSLDFSDPSFLELAGFDLEGIDFALDLDWENLFNMDGFTMPVYSEKGKSHYHDSKDGVSCYWGETREVGIGG